jgi:hypothetical protein
VKRWISFEQLILAAAFIFGIFMPSSARCLELIDKPE